jgi:hypothetical protein
MPGELRTYSYCLVYEIGSGGWSASPDADV